MFDCGSHCEVQVQIRTVKFALDATSIEMGLCLIAKHVSFKMNIGFLAKFHQSCIRFNDALIQFRANFNDDHRDQDSTS